MVLRPFRAVNSGELNGDNTSPVFGRSQIGLEELSGGFCETNRKRVTIPDFDSLAGEHKKVFCLCIVYDGKQEEQYGDSNAVFHSDSIIVLKLRKQSKNWVVGLPIR